MDTRSTTWCSPGATETRQAFLPQATQGVCYVPRVIVTDKLKSYAAAKREIMLGVEHRQHKGLNNQAELSHQLTR